MSLRFYFGASGVGKSTQCFQEMIRRSRFTNDGTPPQKVLIIVPDQFTLQTQKTLSRLHENGGILWIDVLSFGRLAHRVLEKHMGSRVPILDDTGKSLVIQRVASKDLGLQVLGANMRKIGYVHEIKSMLSEFMQYGISPNDMDELIELAGKRGALSWKLKDLQILYQAFCDFIQGHFITAEETLDQVSAHIKDSGVVDDALVVFDGFTGFTPLQERVLYEIMKHAKETIVTLTIGEEDDPYSLGSEQALFYLSKRTVSRLQSIANKAGVERGDDVFLHSERAPRYVNNPALHALESRLFRQSAAPFFEPQDFIRLFEASSPREEVRQCGRKIQEAIRERHLAYRDIAVILGDPKSYSAPIESEFAKLGIPFFLDQSRSIVLNPMIEAIKSALQVRLQDFSQEAVFRFLRCRMTDLTMRDVDALEDYIHQSGIRGASKWTRPFTKTTPRMGDVSEALERLNELRERVMENLAPLCETKKTSSVKEHLDALYDFLIQNRFQDRLHAFEVDFEQSG
ncbi:MAG: exodeoxyribonuclease V subunit gamma, partial [Clostridium sp.]|nr:exodeoxyribonuclease V subunit gamma [Clostridium sp.]